MHRNKCKYTHGPAAKCMDHNNTPVLADCLFSHLFCAWLHVCVCTHVWMCCVCVSLRSSGACLSLRSDCGEPREGGESDCGGLAESQQNIDLLLVVRQQHRSEKASHTHFLCPVYCSHFHSFTPLFGHPGCSRPSGNHQWCKM